MSLCFATYLAVSLSELSLEYFSLLLLLDLDLLNVLDLLFNLDLDLLLDFDLLIALDVDWDLDLLLDLDLLNDLEEKSLLAEVQYLKATIANELKMKKRVPAPDGKFKFVNLDRDTLINSIRTVIKPNNDKNLVNVENLLKNVLFPQKK